MDGPVPRVGERAFRPLRRDTDVGGRPPRAMEGALAPPGAGRRRGADALRGHATNIIPNGFLMTHKYRD